MKQFVQDEPLTIERTFKHQDNLQKAEKLYGTKFKCKIINTKYFNDDEDIMTLVCNENENLIFGK